MRPFNILDGFQLNSVTLKNVDNGKVIWEETEDLSLPYMIHEVHIPKILLKTRAIYRVISFSTLIQISLLRLEQKILFKGRCLEEWYFEFGFVPAHSTQTWTSIIESSPEIQMMPSACILNGNLIIESKFFDENHLITTSQIRLYYE